MRLFEEPVTILFNYITQQARQLRFSGLYVVAMFLGKVNLVWPVLPPLGKKAGR